MLRRILLPAITAIAALATTVTLAVAPAHASAVSCSVKSIPVNVGVVPAQISGTLCVPPGADTLQLLVPGASYAGEPYWDAPGRSYTDLANADGSATFAMDRLDTGGSSQILPALDTVNADATTVHQVIRALGFEHVVLVGHSLGSMVAITYAARYHDIDALVLTGFTERISTEFEVAMATGALIPAQLDPDPRMQARPPGEMTLPNQYRARYFYAADVPSPVIDWDNAHKDIFTVAELGDGLPATLADLPTALVTQRTLLVEGDQDKIFECNDGHPCGSVEETLRDERSAFPLASSLDAVVVHGSGHDLSTSQQYPEQASAVTSWLRGQHFG